MRVGQAFGAGSLELETRNSKLETALRILVVRLGSLGDVIHTLPAVAILRDALPDAFIGWVIEERWAELLCSRTELRGEFALSPEKPLVNAIHTVTTRTWRRHPFAPATRQHIAATVHDLRATHYDLALDFQSAIRSAVIGRLARPQQFIGFGHAHEAPASLFYTRRVEARGRHMVEQNVSLADSLLSSIYGRGTVSNRAIKGSGKFAALAAEGPPASQKQTANGQRPWADDRPEASRPTTDDLSFPLPSDTAHDQWAAEQLTHLRIAKFCLLNAGAGWGAKIWPPERWAEVGRELAQTGMRCIVNYGPGEEELARRVEHESGGTAIAIPSTIGQLIALARRASLCIGGDTGPTHLAAALGVPIVAIYGPTDPARNGPFGPSGSTAQIVVLRSQTSITDHARRAEPEPGLLQISPQHVIAAAERVLSK